MRDRVFLSFQTSNIPRAQKISSRMKRYNFVKRNFVKGLLARWEIFGQSPVRIQ